jgi:hypothetical protein
MNLFNILIHLMEKLIQFDINVLKCRNLRLSINSTDVDYICSAKQFDHVLIR